MAKRSDEQRVQSEIERRAFQSSVAFEHRLVLTMASLEAITFAIASEKDFDAASLHRFAQLDHDRDDVNSALIWAPLVRGPDRTAFVAAQVAAGASDFEIKEPAPDGSLVVAAERDEYLPAIFEEAYDGAPNRPGIDMLSSPERRERADRARDEGKPIATPPVVISPRGEKKLGFLVFWPVYSTGAVPATLEERRATYRGAAVSRLGFDEVLPALIASSPGISTNVTFLIDRGREGGPPQQVGTYDLETRKVTVGEAAIAGPDVGLSVIREFDSFGRHWTIRFDAPPAVVAPLRSDGPWAWLVFGLALTGLTAAFFERERWRRRGVEAVVRQRTADLTHEVEVRREAEANAERSQALIAATLDAAPFAIAIMDVERRVLLWNHTAEQIFGYRAEEVIGQVSPLVDEDRALAAPLIARMLAGEVTRGMPVRRRRKDGRLLDIRLSGAPIQHGGRLSGFMGIYEDVTEQTAALQREVEERHSHELAVRETTERLQAVVDTSVHGMVIIDGKGTISRFNPAAERLFGYRAEEVIGRNVKLLMPAPFHDEHDSYLQHYRRTGERKIIGIGREVVGRRKDGTTFPMDLAVGEATQNGAPMFVGVIIDLTERNRAEATLRLWGDAFEKAAFGIAIDDAATNAFKLVNPAMARLHGRTVAEMQGMPILACYPEEERDRIDALVATADREGHVAFEAPHIREDGSVFPVEMNKTSVRDEAGRILYRVATAFDVTERRQTGDNLRASEERFRSIFSAVGDGIFLTSAANGTFVEVNEPGHAMFGYEPGELIGSTIETISSGAPPYTQREALAWHEKARETGRPLSFDWQCKTKDGKLFWAEISIRFAAVGGEDFVLAIVRDQTARNVIEDQLRQSQKMEAIGNLTGGMAHDFNNLLGVVIGNLDLQRDLLAPGSEPRALADEALDAALRGAELNRRLLAFARRQPLAPQRVALNDLVANIFKLLERTLGEQIAVALDLADFVWPVVVDPMQLESAITNLATNARDAMLKGGRLTFTTANRRLDDDYATLHPEVITGDYALIEVSDSGAGMTQEVMARIFEPFYTTKELGKGTGLGLAMVFGFIKQSGGHINVYSEIGIGTTFRLYLPRALDDVEEVEPPAKTEVGRAGGETVLVVEDNAALRRVVVRQLSELSYKVIEVESASAALAVLARESIDLLFSDVVMPGELDGFALARRVAEFWPSVKVVLTSGFPETNVNGAFEAPTLAARLLTKPYRRDELARAIREALDS